MRFAQHWLSIAAVVVLLVSLYRFVEGFQNWQEARAIKERFNNEIVALERKRDALKLRVEKLQTDDLTQERLARKLGYIKPGETVYKIAAGSRASGVIGTRAGGQ